MSRDAIYCVSLCNLQSMKKIVISLLLFISSLVVYSVPAYPGLITAMQPDGSVVNYYLYGDEYYSYMVSEDGFLLSYNDKGLLVNAELDVVTAQIMPSPNAFTKYSEVKSFLDSIVAIRSYNNYLRVERASSNKGYPLTGSPKSLVILVNYSDRSFKSEIAYKDFSDLLNKNNYSENGATGSARDYFRRASNAIFDPEFVVVGPYDLPNDMKFYGEEDGDVHDKRPGNLIVDACTAADADIDFTDFDENGDGYVDNVFVYYAGYNQAEGGGASTIWPHRSYIVSQVEFDGVRLGDYACTSELRGNSGGDMCGIGTFVHEFGHVLSLPDLYSTNYAGHKTLGAWDVMDNGSYNSNGRTPPTYSAYERFYLGWLQPKQLSVDAKLELEPLSISNSAYLVAETTHNMDGVNPNPKEFFLIENRQKLEHDGVPAQGMLITRVAYNARKWDENTVNNIANSMGVEICCAERGTDVPVYNTFPGKGKVTDYQFKLRGGTVLDKGLSQITENDRLITFVYGTPILNPVFRFEGDDLQAFSAILGEEQIKTLNIKGDSIVGDIKLMLNSTNYSIRKAGTDDEFADNLLFAADADSTIDVNVEIKYAPKVYTYSNYIAETLLLTAQNYEKPIVLRGCAPRPVYVIAPTAYAAEDVSPYTFTAVWDTVFDATEYLLSVYSVEGVDTNFVLIDEIVLAENSNQMKFTVGNLLGGTEYKYRVKASDKDLYGRYENVTDYSNEIAVTTLPGFGAESRKLDVLKDGDKYMIYLPVVDENHSIFIYSIDGRLITSVPVLSNVVEVPQLASNKVYVLKYASNDGIKRKSKVIKLYYE